MSGRSVEAVAVPARYPCSTIFIDESSAKQSAGRFFVVAAVKVRLPGQLARSIQAVRDQTGFSDEFKFSRISRGKLPVFYALVDALEASDAHIAACVVDTRRGPGHIKSNEHPWVGHARITAKLLVGIMNRRELSCAIMDQQSTPVGQAFDDTVRQMVNGRLKATGLVSAVCVDSACHDGVQVADLVAGSVAAHFRMAVEGRIHATSHKAKVAARLASAFGVGQLTDVRSPRVNIMTHGQAPARRPALRSVRDIADPA